MVLLFVVVFFSISGCSSYVNLPAQPGDMASHNPNDATVRDVVGEALSAVVKQYPFEGTFAILLPEKTTADTYEVITTKAGKNAVWPGNKSRNELPVLEVKRVQVRSQAARVDITRPVGTGLASGEEQVVTVDLKWNPFRGWVAQRVQPWRMSVDNAMRVSGEGTDDHQPLTTGLPD